MNHYTILSFCGGGIRELASVMMLEQLYKNHPNIISGANMLAGTSTGGGIVRLSHRFDAPGPNSEPS